MKLWNVTDVLAFYRLRRDAAEHSLPPHLCEQSAHLRLIFHSGADSAGSPILRVKNVFFFSNKCVCILAN